MKMAYCTGTSRLVGQLVTRLVSQMFGGLVCLETRKELECATQYLHENSVLLGDFKVG